MTQALRLAFAALALSTVAYAQTPVPPIPNLATWESQMLSYGATWCADIEAVTPDINGLGNMQYDAVKVFGLIGDYTGDADWYLCQDRAIEIYRDAYSIPNSGGLPEQYQFTTGLRHHYARTADTVSRDAAYDIADSAAFCGPEGTELQAYLDDPDGSRALAYCMTSYINAEGMGRAHNDRLELLRDRGIDYIDQWFITKDYRTDDPYEIPEASDAWYIQPFYVHLVLDALIRYDTVFGDANVLPTVKLAIDFMDEWLWIAAGSFPYNSWLADPPPPLPIGNPSWDLNNLMVYNYQWLYEKTSDTRYRDRADALFSALASNESYAYGGQKFFNQGMTYAFDFVASRRTDKNAWFFVRPLDTSVLVQYGAIGIPYSSDCVVTLKDSGGTPIDTETTTEGPSRRTAIFTGLTASTTYKLSMDTCQGGTRAVADTTFTTLPTPVGGDRTVPVQIGAPSTALAALGAARCTLDYDDNAGMSSPTSVQDTTCSSGGSADMTVPAGVWYYRWRWQTSGDAVLATGTPQPLNIP
jgi:hypothetical protein